MLNFLGGAAQAGTRDLQKRSEMAMELKMRSSLMEQELMKQEALFDYQKASPEVTFAVGQEFAGPKGQNPFAQGQRASTAELGLLSGISKAKASASARMFSGRDSMTGKELKEATGVDLPIPDDAVLNPTQVRVWQRRLTSEEPTADAKNQHVGIKQGMTLFSELEKARKEAAKEIGTGPIAGRAAESLSKLEQGSLGPATKKYLALRESHGTKIARFLGERGIVTDKDVAKALNIVPGMNVDDTAAQTIFDKANELSRKDIEELEEAYPSLKRKRQNEEAGKQMQGLYSSMKREDKMKAFEDAIQKALGANKK